MIKLIDISKKFNYKKREIKVLDNVNYEIYANEMIAITGPSGVGNTTLLNIIGGIYRQSSGQYLFEGKEVGENELHLNKFRRENIGFVLQNNALIKNRDVFYNIALPLKYKGFKRKDIEEHVSEIALKLCIEDKLRMPAYLLSGGEAQRVAIARAVVSKPKIIIADEPTSSLDEYNKDYVIEILRDLRVEGSTVIIATHDSFVSRLCDRTLILRKEKTMGMEDFV